MTITRLVATSAGPVEITRTEGTERAVLFFPGGHCRASTDCGQDLYTGLGHEVISFSRPGYGRTRVGPLDAAAFADVVREVCEQLGVLAPVAAVGVSFGGLQAVQVAGHRSIGVERLVLHSSAPSTLSYPDSRAEALLGPVAFSPAVERTVWWLVRRLVRSDSGLRVMLAQLSTLAPDQWWDDLSATEKDQAREVFNGMSSGSGFVNDLRQARAKDASQRQAALARVTCPALITASPHDGGVDYAHARDLQAHLEPARLVELPSRTHLFWIGPGHDLAIATIRDFLND